MLPAALVLKPVPVMETKVPIGPEAGEKEVIVGEGAHVNPIDDAFQAGCVIVTVPVAPVLTTALISVGEITVNEVAFTPPIVTAVVPVKLDPEIFNIVPCVPVNGENELIEASATNPARVSSPPGVVMITEPDEHTGTIAVIRAEETTVNDVTLTPPIVTAVVPVKLFPFIVIVLPAVSSTGENDVITGGGI
jgi:hypothetical protein